MDSALSPRDIQTRIRGGESVEDVAKAAGVSADKIEGFATPVIAEREHVAGLAQTSPVRRSGETGTHRMLRQAVVEQLVARRIDPDSVRWDAWRVENRRWAVQACYEQDGAERTAMFTYDQNGRFSTAADDEARGLIGERTAAAPASATAEDFEATMDFDDEFALVRATQGDVPLATAEPAPALDEAASPATATDDDDAAAEPAAPAQPLDDTEDAFSEDDFREVDGRYDIVPGRESEMDILYDMLSSFNEDSVQIYAGLNRPVTDESPTDEPVPQPTEISPDDVEIADDAVETAAATAPSQVAEPIAPAAAEPVAVPDAALSEPESSAEPTDDAARDEWLEAEAFEEHDQPAAPPAAQPVAPAPEAPEPVEPAEPEESAQAAEPEQLALVDVPEAEASAPAPKPKQRSRRKRATVPSWDEIMFGVPKPPERPKE